MTEKQLGYFNDLLNMAMNSMDRMVETDGAMRGAGEIVFNKIYAKGKCRATRGMNFNFSHLRSDMKAWLSSNVPAEPKSIEDLKDWLWVKDFVGSIADATIYFIPEQE